eukprot:4346505-Alexandrium_andersonii.AAC.1
MSCHTVEAECDSLNLAGVQLPPRGPSPLARRAGAHHPAGGYESVRGRVVLFVAAFSITTVSTSRPRAVSA